MTICTAYFLFNLQWMLYQKKREKDMIFRFNYNFDSKRGSDIGIHRGFSEFSSFVYFIEPSFSCPMCFKSFTKALFKEHAPFCSPTKLKFLSQSGCPKVKDEQGKH